MSVLISALDDNAKQSASSNLYIWLYKKKKKNVMFHTIRLLCVGFIRNPCKQVKNMETPSSNGVKPRIEDALLLSCHSGDASCDPEVIFFH